ncbi:MAG: hypothetical protein PHY73_00290 [Candidatus Omnitrophica bacterium]|nr:hypothetical protein [Candidatus Omnitrophota bacterium]
MIFPCKNKAFPAKIKTLFLLRSFGFFVPDFFIVDEKRIRDENFLKREKQFLQNKKVKYVIIRSASITEDGRYKTNAGIFESSPKLLLDEVSSKKIYEYWIKNLEKVSCQNPQNLFLIIQDYFDFDYSGVLFTQMPYFSWKACVEISKEAEKITSGRRSDFSAVFDKNSRKWSESIFSRKIQIILEKIIKNLEKYDQSGWDIEFGIKGDSVAVWQARMIVQSEDEKILFLEKERLKNKFKNTFEQQLWEKNTFIQSLGDLTYFSITLYNFLLRSETLYQGLLRNGFCEKRKGLLSFDILENIGGRTYWNKTQEKEYFPRREGFFFNFKRLVVMKINYEIIRKEIKESEARDLESVFSYFFLSGVFLSFFLEQEKIQQKDSFLDRLRQTEFACGATSFFPVNMSKKETEDFLQKYGYLCDYPYEVASVRYDEDSSLLLRAQREKVDFLKNGPFLCEDVQFWMKQRVRWKEVFLRMLQKMRVTILKKHPKDFFRIYSYSDFLNRKMCLNKEIKEKKEKRVQGNYMSISGRFFPNPLPPVERSRDSIIIFPGEIPREQCCRVDSYEDIRKYSGRFVLAEYCPNHWIPYLSTLKGLVLCEGNILSHVAITCRENMIPCRICRQALSGET